MDTPQEVDAILNFVRGGGGLILLGVGQLGTQDLILEPMGVSYVGRPLSSDDHLDWGAWGFKFNTTSSDGLLAGVSQVTLNAETAINVELPGVAFLSTNSNTWLDTNENQIKDGGESTGPFSVAAQVQLGQGRVVILPGTFWGG